MKFRRAAALWLALALSVSACGAGLADDPNASVVQGSATGQPLPVTGTVTANQGTAGLFPWLVAIDNWLASIGVTQLTSPWVVGFGGVAQPVSGTVAVSNFPATQPVSGTVSATQGTTPWVVDGSGVTQPVSGSVSVSNFPATQPVSGTVTANQGGAPWSQVGTLTNDSAAPGSNNIGVLGAKATAASPSWTEGHQVALSTDLTGQLRVVTSGGSTVTQGTTPWVVDGSGVTQPVSGTVSVGNFPATQPVSGTVTANQGTSPWVVDGSGATQPISAAALPLPSGAATAIKQPALGTAGSASADVITVQGIASMTALKVDGSAVTQPVSGTFFQATQPVSVASLPLPTGASTEATLALLPVAQASTTSGQSGPLAQGAVTTAAPSYTTAKTSPLSLTTAGALRVDGSAVTQPVSGTVTANAGSGTFTVAGTKTNNSAVPGATNVGALVGIANAAAPTYIEGDQVLVSTNLSGSLRATADQGVKNGAGTASWPIQGTEADADTSVGNPIRIAGLDGGTGLTRTWAVNAQGAGRVALYNQNVDGPSRVFYSTFRTLGNAASPQVLFTIHRANVGGLGAIRIRKLTVTVTYTAALTAVENVVDWGRSTALPTGGTALTAVNADTTRAVSANCVALGATASDGGGATAITATLAARAGGSFIGRIHTAVGHVNSGTTIILIGPGEGSDTAMILRTNEGLMVRVVNPTAGNNAATIHYVVNCEAEEVTLIN